MIVSKAVLVTLGTDYVNFMLLFIPYLHVISVGAVASFLRPILLDLVVHPCLHGVKKRKYVVPYELQVTSDCVYAITHIYSNL